MRSYKQFCGVAKALDVVGERWTLLLVRELLLGPRRYSDLLSALKGLTTNLLADRLRRMTAEGLIERVTLPAPSGARVYQLTARGRELEAVVLALGAFGASYLTEPGGDAVNLRWAALSLKRRWNGTGEGTMVLRAPTRSFTIVLGAPLLVMDGELPADVVLTGEEPELLAALFGADSVTVDGDAAVWKAFRDGLR
ncbi:MAG: helix-turn-helix transcriptional regulator [Proteobacteria bacterium]|nr:helix-turn-helix transcriptional regulator [Pseudomonadota bacterium]